MKDSYMIGKNVLTLDYNDFIKGMSTSDNLPDGGFSPTTSQVNLINSHGAVYQPAVMVDASTNLATADDIIATCEEPTGTNNRMILAQGSANLGTFYTLSTSNVLTSKVSTTTAIFGQGTTDFVPWQDTVNGLNYYATTGNDGSNNGNIVKWNGNVTKDEVWWSSTLAQSTTANTAWRPLLVYETHLYFGNKNTLHRISPSLAVSAGILTLAASEYITALGVDKGTGYMLIAVTNGLNASATLNLSSKILLYDGLSNKVARVIPVEGLVTSFKNMDDSTYVFFGNNIGVFTGSGIRFLRKLDFAIGNSSLLVYPHRATAIENTLYFVENNKVIAYGEIRGNSAKVFRPALKNTIGASPNFTSVVNVGANKLGISFNGASSVRKFYTFDTSSVATSGTAEVWFNRVNFPRPIQIREFYIEFNSALANNSTACLLSVLGEVQSFNTQTFTNTSGTSIYAIRQKCNFNGLKFNSMYMRLAFNSDYPNIGIKRITVSYDFVE